MIDVLQVGVGSGGMPVLDAVARDERVTSVTLLDPDVYENHNVGRHLFGVSSVGRPKVELAAEWLAERRPGLAVDARPWNLLDAAHKNEIEQFAAACDVGICAADNEPAKFHFDALLRSAGKPWTLGEVLSGGIGGFVHRFVPGGPCYGCVASHLQRTVTEAAPAPPPDYSAPGGAIQEARVPAPKAAITAIAGLHAVVTLGLLDEPADDPGFTSLLLTLRRVPGVFDEAFRPFRFRVPKLDGCLICGRPAGDGAGDDLDVALDQAFARLGDA
jgi:molybdopterin/thiamine biosynthesis adenylyltransferase